MAKTNPTDGVPFTVYKSEEKRKFEGNKLKSRILETIEIDGKKVIVDSATKEPIGLGEISCKVKFPHQENFSYISEWKLLVREDQKGDQEIVLSRLPIKSTDLEKYSFVFN